MKNTTPIIVLLIIVMTATIMSCGKRDCRGKKLHKTENGLYI